MAKKKGKPVGIQLTTGIQENTIRQSAMRELILKRLTELKMTRYELGKAVEPHGVSLQAVYGYLSGRRDMTSGLVWHLLKALRLEIRPKD